MHTEANSTIYSQAGVGINNKDSEKYNVAMELETLAKEEFFKMIKIFRDIEFAHGRAIDMLFGYKLQDLKREEDLGKFKNSFMTPKN
jgi:hypothetical protein